MKLLANSLAISAIAVLLLADTAPALAQTSAAEILEQARGRSRDMEELKAVLNGPDQNMRLAVFDVMVTNGDNAMREIAIEMGLASADPLMQAMAFKEVIMGLDRIVMSLEIDTTQPETVQAKAQVVLNSTGSSYSFQITDRDRKAGTFKMRTNSGQVSGTMLSFKNGHDEGTLSLVDETTMKGEIRIYKGGYGGFIATAKIR